MKYLVKQERYSERRVCILVGMSRSVVRYVVRKRRGERKSFGEISRKVVQSKAEQRVEMEKLETAHGNLLNLVKSARR